MAADFEIVIEVKASDERLAEALRKSVNPDNALTPEGIVIEDLSEGPVVRYVVRCSDPSKLLTLRNTVDDLLEKLEVAEKAIRATRGLARGEENGAESPGETSCLSPER